MTSNPKYRKVHRQAGVLVISLDFELHWGILDRVNPSDHMDYFYQTKQAVPKILELFGQYGIQATWATVGMLMAPDREILKAYYPALWPVYDNPSLSPYHWLQCHAWDKRWHAAPELLERILKTPGQEIGSHTFSHFYAAESGQDTEQFREDLWAAKAIAQDRYGIALTSLVFPRNQYSRHYLQVAGEEGFITYRSNPADWFWRQPEKKALPKKIGRTGDCYVPLGKTTSYAMGKLSFSPDEPLAVPASRLFRPWQQKYPFLNNLKMKRIMHEMTHAAQKGEIYHLWWHPHNFGRYPAECLQELEVLLKHFSMLRNEMDMQSLSMGNVAASL